MPKYGPSRLCVSDNEVVPFLEFGVCPPILTLVRSVWSVGNVRLGTADRESEGLVGKNDREAMGMVMLNDVGLFKGTTGNGEETREATGVVGVGGASFVPVSPVTVEGAPSPGADFKLSLGISE